MVRHGSWALSFTRAATLMKHTGLSAWPGGIYADTSGTFGDNQFRFALLSLAACEAPLVLNIGGYRCVCLSAKMLG